MKDQGEISDRVFSFYLAHPNEESFVEIGGYTTTHIKNNDDNLIVWYDIPDSYFWIHFVNAIRVGENN